MSTASRSAADMLEVGWPEPALVEQRIESTRSWAASSATVAKSVVVSASMAVMPIFPPRGRAFVPSSEDAGRSPAWIMRLSAGRGRAQQRPVAVRQLDGDVEELVAHEWAQHGEHRRDPVRGVLQ